MSNQLGRAVIRFAIASVRCSFALRSFSLSHSHTLTLIHRSDGNECITSAPHHVVISLSLSRSRRCSPTAAAAAAPLAAVRPFGRAAQAAQEEAPLQASQGILGLQ